jgi:hypothetical protein
MMPGVELRRMVFCTEAKLVMSYFGFTVLIARHGGHVKNIAEALLALAMVAEPGAVLARAPRPAISKVTSCM